MHLFPLLKNANDAQVDNEQNPSIIKALFNSALEWDMHGM